MRIEDKSEEERRGKARGEGRRRGERRWGERRGEEENRIENRGGAYNTWPIDKVRDIVHRKYNNLTLHSLAVTLHVV